MLECKEDALIGIQYVEKVLYNSVEIQNLFKENNNKAIQFKIEKLQSAAMLASIYFTDLGNLTEEEQSLLNLNIPS